MTNGALKIVGSQTRVNEDDGFVIIRAIASQIHTFSHAHPLLGSLFFSNSLTLRVCLSEHELSD